MSKTWDKKLTWQFIGVVVSKLTILRIKAKRVLTRARE
jgi:hypothetical protein